MSDGINSAIRYVKNNFLDGDRQDGIDLVLGKYRVESGEGASTPCPLRDTRDTRLLLLPLAVSFSLLMVFACILMPSEYTSTTLMSLMFWAVVGVLSGMLTLRQGRRLVNSPKLYAPPALSGHSTDAHVNT